MTGEAIVLAGGLGTRLRTVVADTPKCLAPVAGKPFLYHVFAYLEKQGIRHVILSLGYKYAMVKEWCDRNKLPFQLSYAIEPEPMGTGGGIKNALQHAREKEIFILNGDTLFNVPLATLNDFHRRRGAALSLSLKPMRQFDRYGVVKLGEDDRVLSFEEKKWYEQGLINGGVYLMDVRHFQQADLPGRFSFENDYLLPRAKKELFYGFISDTYFIDIGIPEDYERAQTGIQTAF